MVEQLEDRRLLHQGSLLPPGFTEVEVASGFNNPTAMDIAFDNRVFIAEEHGTVRVVKNNSLLATPFLEVEVVDDGESGLVGLVLDPQFHENNHVYVYYTVRESPTVHHNRVSRFTANGDVADPDSELVILNLEPLNDSGLHGGGALAFGADGKLYIGVGDNAVASDSQSLDTRRGKILRINPDGTIPEDNPFFDTATGDNRSIWALGLRNPFTMTTQPGTGRIFINDVGAGAFEEINDGAPGANYGWPATEGTANTPPYVDPVLAYAHGAGSDEGCAITGGVFYNPQFVQFPDEFVGDYFFMDFCNGWIQRYDPADGSVTPFAQEIAGFPVHLKLDNDGSLYYLSLAEDALFRIDQPSDFAPQIVLQPQDQAVAIGQSVTFTVSAAGSGPLAFQWQRDGVDLPNATSNSLTIPQASLADDNAEFRVVVSNPFGTATSHVAMLSVISGQVPLASITAPDSTITYGAGDRIVFSGLGTDPDDGDLAAQAMTWRVDFHHDQHAHPFMPNTAGIASGSFTVPTTGETSPNVWYRIHLTVQDSDGLTHSTFHDVFPNTSVMSFTSNVPGTWMSIDGQPIATATTVEGVVNTSRDFDVASPQTIGDNVYQFLSWSDAGDRAHSVSTPPLDSSYELLFGLRRLDPLDPGYAESDIGWQDGPASGNSGVARVSSDPNASVVWTPLLRPGFHHVSIYKQPIAANTDNAVITIRHNQQTDVLTLDLSSGEAGWVYLGRFFFDGLGDENVTIHNGAGRDDLLVDSIEFHNGDELDDDLVAYLSFDEGRGTVAADTSPSGKDNTGILQAGAGWSPFGLNGSVQLNGANAVVVIPNTPDINQSTREELSISAWFRVQDASIANRKQLIYEQGGESRGLNIYVHDGKLYVGVWNESVANWTGTFLSTDALQSGTWHHVALVLDGSATLQPNALTGYLDGEVFGTGEAVRSVFHGGGIGVGRANGQTRFHDGVPLGNANGFAGEIDETRVYQRALTDREVELLGGDLIVRQFLVTSVQDSGDADPGDGVCDDGSGSCTLRAAIEEANALPNLFGPDTILFDIPGVAPYSIQATAPLPQIVDPIVIDATSQPGFGGLPIIELDGSLAGATSSGIVVMAGSSVIRGLAVTHFAANGIVLAEGGGNTIEHNHVGTNVAGTEAASNGSHGIVVSNSPANVIGGMSPDTANVISGNGIHGVFLSGSRTTHNVVDGNIIGLGSNGATQIGNGGVGVRIDQGASRNTIGGSGNVISHNGTSGVLIFGQTTADNTIAGNAIGTDISGLLDRGNGTSGVVIDGASGNKIGVPGNGNVISGNTGNGIFLGGSGALGNLVQGNLVGVNATGTAAIPNNLNGLTVFESPNNTIGGVISDAHNLFSGNDKSGVFIVGTNATGNRIEGNLIGTDEAGATAIPNRQFGVVLHNAPSNTVGGTGAAAANVISGNLQGGVGILRAGAFGNVVSGNLIGSDVTGTLDVGNAKSGVLIWNAPTNSIGGLTAAERNVISGNELYGVRITSSSATDNTVRGNYIGTDIHGTTALPNSDAGVQLANAKQSTIGGTASGAGNVISGNSKHGVVLVGAEVSDNRLQGNFIGVDTTGAKALGNSIVGVRIGTGAHHNTIGGAEAGAGNVISANGSDGVLLVNDGTHNNTVAGNLIGTNHTGTTPLGNTRHGVFIIDSDSNTIGGTALGAGNVISANKQAGVAVFGNATGNAIQRNSMFSNGGLGIDLGLIGFSANDMTLDSEDIDTGSNNLQNSPVLSLAALAGNNLDVTYSVPTNVLHAAYPLTIEYFLADAQDQEGRVFLGTDTYVSAEALNAAMITLDVTGKGVTGSGKIVATATDNTGNTSEFSANITVSVPLLAASEPILSAEACRGFRGDSPVDAVELAKLQAGLPPIVAAALVRWQQADIDANQLSRLRSIDIRFAELDGAYLGLSTGNTILLDTSAAGYGWFIDPTPLDDSESDTGASRSDRATERMDLLTAVMHEMGHALGLEDVIDDSLASDVMLAHLQPGERHAL